eukprot:9488251-Pyramimonas_sp.AAC.1
MHCVWLHSGTPSCTPNLPEDVQQSSWDLLFWPSEKGGNNCPPFRDAVGTWRTGRRCPLFP